MSSSDSDLEKMLERTMQASTPCRKCGERFTFEEAASCARNQGIVDKVLMCPKCRTIYDVEVTPRGVTLLDDATHRYTPLPSPPQSHPAASPAVRDPGASKAGPLPSANLARITGTEDLKKLQTEHPKKQWWQFWRWASPNIAKLKDQRNFDELYKLFLNGAGDPDCRRAAAAAIQELGPSNDPNPVLRTLTLSYFGEEWVREWAAAYYSQSRLFDRLRGLMRLANEHRGQLDKSQLASETFTQASNELLTGWLGVKGPLQEGAVLELLHRDAGHVAGILMLSSQNEDRRPLARALVDVLLASTRRPDTLKTIARYLSVVARVPQAPDGQDWEDWWATNMKKFAPQNAGPGTASN